jgi:DNA polymerase-3 subunit epsilon
MQLSNEQSRAAIEGKLIARQRLASQEQKSLDGHHHVLEGAGRSRPRGPTLQADKKPEVLPSSLSPRVVDPSPMKLAVIDLETTGFAPGDCIVEIGVVELDLETGQTEVLIDMPVREGQFTREAHGRSWIFRHSTLEVSDVLGATSWRNARRELAWVLDKYAVTAFNKAFDFRFLIHRGLEPKRHLPCPMMVASEVLRLPGVSGSCKWPSLEEAWRHYFPGDGYIEQHRAFDDAVHEALLIKAMHVAGDYRIEESD